MTRLVHGSAGLNAAQRITEALFSGDTGCLSEADLEQLRLDGLPSTPLVWMAKANTPAMGPKPYISTRNKAMINSGIAR